jgi:hypothetical protein
VRLRKHSALFSPVFVPFWDLVHDAVVNGGVRELLRSLAKTRYEDSEFRGREKYQARLIEKSTEAFQRVADFFPCPLRHYPAKFCTFAVLSALFFEPKIKKLQEMSGSKFQ